MAYKFAFVMDPLESMLPDKDTTFVFMLESLARGHQVFHLGLKGLYTQGHQAFAFARRCEVARTQPHHRFLDDGRAYPLESFDAIFMRKDPPADDAYI
ncbi:MAG: glutathione synthase, partial [Gammaproteobacteria bacterium]